MTNINKFSNLTFDDFKKLAENSDLTRHEKVGFPDMYRDGKEEDIFEDILQKLPILNEREKVVLEIGPGCSQLPLMLSDLSKNMGHKLLFVDSEEMLSHLPNEPHIVKFPGRYPEVRELFDVFQGKVDVIISYSVIQYIFFEGNINYFLDRSMELLNVEGMMLIGDLPNISMRKRFFSSDTGIYFHQEYMGKVEVPKVEYNVLETGNMDDSVILGLVARARMQGFHAWILPQNSSLPMANRREDILIKRP